MPNYNKQHNSCMRRKPAVQVLNTGFATPSVTDAYLWLEKGAPSAEKSSAADLSQVAGGTLNQFHFTSDTPCLSTIVVRDPETSLIVNQAKIELSGTGCSDFTSKGAAVLAYERGTVTLNDCEITTRGATRCCTIATSGATMTIRNCKLASYGGPLPEDYVPVIGPGMMEPPYPLGLSGNCRTHLSMDNSETFFYNCDIYAAAWAAVSSDAGGGYCYAEVNDSNILTEGNGYCGYADNGCHLAFFNCKMSSGNMAFIQDGDSSILVRNCDCSCGKIGMLIHGGMENDDDIGVIELHNTNLQTKNQVMLCKSTNVDLYMEGCTLKSEDGIILESKITDDRMYFTRRTIGPQLYGVQATFENMDITGDFLMGDSERRNCLHFANTTVTGTIAGNPQVWLHEGSKWLSTGSSIVTLMGDTELSALDAGVAGGPMGMAMPNVIYAYAGEGCTLSGEYTLPSGGKLVML